ncbi:MAG TPA: aldo/keto reductase [Terriglobales bacterium]|jgi:aryl-alcohol dehydrogenase-like predicted oxidoreductase|nr:aldo/keto reductase [Terriglobales bacterium]
MEFVQVSGSDLNGSRIGLGTWSIGGMMWGGTDERDAIRTIRAALDRGINLIDSATGYGWGRAEEIIGKTLAEDRKREEVIIATKFGLEPRGDGIGRNSSRERILKEVEDSLNRFRTSYIDIYQVHWPDENTPFEETAETLAKLKKQGKILAVGVSNYSAKQIERFRKVTPVNTVQSPYNVFERGIENDALPYARQHHITTLLYGPLCRGLLSGRMNSRKQFQGDDIRKNDPKFQPPRFEQYLDAVQKLDRFAQENYGKRVIHLALRWVLDEPGCDIALWGARKPEQLEAIDGVFGWKLDQDARRQIDQIVSETVGQPVGPEFMAPAA